MKQGARKRTLGNCVQTEEFREGYQPRSNLTEDKNSDLLADLSIILNKWKHNLSVSQCTVHGVSDIRQSAEHTAGQLMSKRSAYEAEMAI